MQTIQEQIQTGQLAPFLLLYGEERYMVKYYKDSIVKSLGLMEDSMNSSYYEGDSVNLSEIIDVAQTMPFMAPKRLIIVENSGFFKSANDLADFLPQVSDSTVMLFVEKEIDKRNRNYKFIQKSGVVTECKIEGEQALVNWVAKYLKAAGKTVSRETVYAIMSRVGLGMNHLSTELEKLIGYTADKDCVEMEDVEAVCSEQASNRIFDMVDFVADGKQKQALELYHDLVQLKEPPARILFLFSRHVNILMQVCELEGRRAGREEIAKKVGVPPFTISKYSSQMRKFQKTQLQQMLAECISLEESIKTGKMGDQIAVELFIIRHTK